MTIAFSPIQVLFLSPSSFAAQAIGFFSGMTASQGGGITVEQIRAMSARQIAALPTSAIGGLTVSAQAALTAANIKAMTPQQIAQLSPSVISGLSNAALEAISPAQMAALSAAQLNGLTPAQFALFATSQIAALTPSQIANLGAPELQAISISAFTPGQVASMTAAVISRLSPNQFASLLSSRLASLTAAQIAGPSATEIQSLTTAEVKSLSNSQVAALTAAQIGSLTSAQLGALTPAEISALSLAQLAGLTSQQIAALSVAQIGGLAGVQLAILSIRQTAAFTAAQLNSMTGAQIAALHPGALTAAQVGALSAATIASLSAAAFDAVIVPEMQALSVQAIKGLTIAELASLTTAQLSSFTVTQIAAMTAQNAAIVKAAQTANPVIEDAATRESNGSLSFASLQAILQDADAGAMTTVNFQGLRQIASELNAVGGISTSAYAQQMFDNVVLGNVSNAWWNGGSNTTKSLGDLSATSTQTQTAELIDKWFIGSDNPGIGSGAEGYPTSYTTASSPLWGANGPSVSNVNQGQIGDCYFMSALGELALQNPTAIENMIEQNSNGSYAVEFQVNGHADWVTVNNQLPEFNWGGGQSSPVFANGEGTIWAPLIEKAFVELTEQIYGAQGANYDNIDGGSDNGLQLITGQNDNWFGLSSGETSSSLQSLLGQLQSAFTGKEEILFASETNDSAANLVGSHMYMVTGVNAATGTISLANPWGANGAGSGLAMSFTDSISTLAAQSGDGFYVTTGKPALG